MVDISNLSRQSLYGQRHIGQKKHLAAKEVILEQNPKIQVEAFELELTEDCDIREYIQDAKLVINCTDYPGVFLTSKWVSKQCMELNIPHIVAGGYRANKGMIGPTIIPFQTACWKCYELSFVEKNDERVLIMERNSDHIGSINVIAAIVANIQVWDGIRVLIGAEPLVTNRKGNFNFKDLSFNWYPFERNLECPICGSERK